MADQSEEIVKQTERFEQLSETVSVCVSPEHRFGTDAFLLADFASPRQKDRVCDFGTGCGIIPLYIYKEYNIKECYGVEIQEEAVSLFQKGIVRSGASERVKALHCDLKLAPGLLPKGSFDVITCNPPYFPGGTGFQSETEAHRIARHEIFCTVGDICEAAALLLRYGGRLCVCQRPERLCDLLTAMRENGMEPKRLRFVAKTPRQKPWLVLCEGKKGAKPFLEVGPSLFIEEGGRYFGLKKEPSAGTDR